MCRQARRFAAGVAVCAFVALGPGAALASAANVEVSGTTLVVTASGSEANRITIDRTPSIPGHDVIDTGANPVPGAGCAVVDPAQPNRVRCGGAITQIQISAGG